MKQGGTVEGLGGGGGERCRGAAPGMGSARAARLVPAPEPCPPPLTPTPTHPTPPHPTQHINHQTPGIGVIGGIVALLAVLAVTVGRSGGPESLSTVGAGEGRRRGGTPWRGPAPRRRERRQCGDGPAAQCRRRRRSLESQRQRSLESQRQRSASSLPTPPPTHPPPKQVAGKLEGDSLSVIAQRLQRTL
jgi:hypothetical protein